MIRKNYSLSVNFFLGHLFNVLLTYSNKENTKMSFLVYDIIPQCKVSSALTGLTLAKMKLEKVSEKKKKKIVRMLLA